MTTGDNTKLPLTSRDVHRERLAQLRELFPEAFTEGKTEFDKLAQILAIALQRPGGTVPWTWPSAPWRRGWQHRGQ